jgi:hypothetical protein
MGVEAAIFLVNRVIEQDAVLTQIFAPKPVLVYPGYGDEAHDEMKSYPYIRYQSMPIPTRSLPYLRRDWCQYFVGDVDYTKVINAIERIIYVLNIAISEENLGWGVPDASGKFKIMDVLVHNATIPNIPSQDLGVWEQGIAFSMRYTVKPSWSVETRKTHDTDALLDT